MAGGGVSGQPENPPGYATALLVDRTGTDRACDTSRDRRTGNKLPVEDDGTRRFNAENGQIQLREGSVYIRDLNTLYSAYEIKRLLIS